MHHASTFMSALGPSCFEIYIQTPEAVWKNGTPCWAMNYSGRLLDEAFSFDFLKEALMNVSQEMPYRGPELYQRDNFTYQCSAKGDFEWFYGYEEIYHCEQRIYECAFHGGIVK